MKIAAFFYGNMSLGRKLWLISMVVVCSDAYHMGSENKRFVSILFACLLTGTDVTCH